MFSYQEVIVNLFFLSCFINIVIMILIKLMLICCNKFSKNYVFLLSFRLLSLLNQFYSFWLDVEWKKIRITVYFDIINLIQTLYKFNFNFSLFKKNKNKIKISYMGLRKYVTFFFKYQCLILLYWTNFVRPTLHLSNES